MTAVFVIIEMFLLFRKYPSKRAAYIGLAIFGVCYASWIIFGKLKTGSWVYPVIENFSMWALIFGPFCVYFYESLFYLLGEWINNKFWASELRKYNGQNSPARKGSEI
jgi:hypothetical protein